MNRLVLVAASSCLLFAACSSKPTDTKPATTSAPAASPGATAQAAAAPQPTPTADHPAKYDMKGKVVSVDKDNKRVYVANEDIPGFMSAMTMAYPVKDEHQLDGLTSGEAITAKVIYTGSQFWLEDLAAAK